MQKVTIDEVDTVPHFMGANHERRPLAREIEGMDFAMTHLELAPGEAFSGGLHTHHDQEELFFVLEGTATWEVRTEPDGESETIDVRAGEVLHFEAGDAFQTGVNEGDEPVIAIAIGVPGTRHRWSDTEAVLECTECERDTAHTIVPEGEETRMPAIEDMVITCTDCGHEMK